MDLSIGFITIYNFSLFVFMLGYFILVWIFCRLLKALKRLIGKTIIKLEKAGIL